jgi:hypothetical protein
LLARSSAKALVEELVQQLLAVMLAQVLRERWSEEESAEKLVQGMLAEESEVKLDYLMAEELVALLVELTVRL